MRYGKVVAEFFEGSVSAGDTSLLNKLIPINKRPGLLGAVSAAASLAVAGAPHVAGLPPPPPMAASDDGSIDAGSMIEVDAHVPEGGRKCPAVLPKQARTL